MREIQFMVWNKVKNEMLDPVGEMDLNQEGVMQYTASKTKTRKRFTKGI